MALYLVPWPPDVKIREQTSGWWAGPDERKARLNNLVGSYGRRWSPEVDRQHGTIELTRLSAYPRHRDKGGVLEGFLTAMREDEAYTMMPWASSSFATTNSIGRPLYDFPGSRVDSIGPFPVTAINSASFLNITLTNFPFSSYVLRIGDWLYYQSGNVRKELTVIHATDRTTDTQQQSLRVFPLLPEISVGDKLYFMHGCRNDAPRRYPYGSQRITRYTADRAFDNVSLLANHGDGPVKAGDWVYSQQTVVGEVPLRFTLRQVHQLSDGGMGEVTTISPSITGSSSQMCPASMIRVKFSTPEQLTWNTTLNRDRRGPWVIDWEEVVDGI